ncbi:MAG: hypothetical protein IPJ68_00180 [Candidatus Moraniibacteriota bacterium]|nr:MAG: hypothetical protein IPJ68_00180 [Candidatus Moranbacteria bacterium]
MRLKSSGLLFQLPHKSVICGVFLFALVGLFAFSGMIAQAATYYVGKSGSNSNTCGTATSSTAANRKLTVSAGLGCLSAGDTLTIGDGTYSETLQSIPNGTSGNYIVVRAENNHSVVMTGLSMINTDAYINVIGINFRSGNNGKEILGNHLKFQKCEFRGGASSGNQVNLLIGSNDFNDTADILLEDIVVHGVANGRYNVLVYNADRVVLRRAVIRHDGGWTGPSNPSSGINFYVSSDSWCLNCVVLDSLASLDWSGAFYMVKNSSVAHANNGNGIVGSIILNNPDLGLRMDASASGNDISNVTLTDNVLWDNANGGIAMCCAGSVTSTSTRLTIGRSTVTLSGDWKGGIGDFSAGSNTAISSIFHDIDADVSGMTATYCDTFSNLSTNCSTTGRQTYDPLSNGLLYLPRIEAASNLKTAGSGGGQLGAQIVNKIGTDGTLQGESGWNTDTGNVLWPWPDESWVKQVMCTDVSITRGFCGSASLTQYIMNYLGNGNPYSGTDTTPPAAPTGLGVN